MRKVCEFGCFILPKCGADKKVFLSAVYKKGTQAKKCRLEVAQFGRSMVEMLGVLAIIGVLSVGGIAGYSKAMFKYKLNKQYEQLNTVINAISRYYKDLNFNTDVNVGSKTIIPHLKSLNEIPEEMYIKNNDNQIKDVFGNQYHIYSHNTGYVGVMINFRYANYPVEVCKNLHLAVKPFMEDIYDTFVSIDGNYTSYVFGNKNCVTGVKCYKNITLSDINDICNSCEKDKDCTLYIVWR